MKRIAIQIACAVFFFFLSFKLTIRTPAPSDEARKNNERGNRLSAKYAGIKTRREYFAAVFSDPRLQIDSGIVKMAKSRNKGKELIISFSIPNLQSSWKKIHRGSRRSSRESPPKIRRVPELHRRHSSAGNELRQFLSAIISR